VSALQQLTGTGVSLWLDGLDRGALVGGEFARLVRNRSVTGVTTDAVTLHAALAGDPRPYADEIAECRARGLDPVPALRALAATDVRLACDDLRPVFDATGGTDGYASIGVDPRLEDDVATVAEARRLTRLVDRPNVMVGIPATDCGLRAVPSCLAEGLSVNVTLTCGLRRYAQAIDAFMDGLERLRLAGGDLRAVASVASCVTSGVDAEVARRVPGAHAAETVRGRVAVANARRAHRLFTQSLQLPRWFVLAASGARPQRPAWVSTSSADPALGATSYVGGLPADDVVLTVPAAVLVALAEQETLPPPGGTDGCAVLDGLAGLGVDLDDVVACVEREEIRSLAAAARSAARLFRS
jgi:transaldolase